MISSTIIFSLFFAAAGDHADAHDANEENKRSRVKKGL
jgi:hypothetical protein